MTPITAQAPEAAASAVVSVEAPEVAALEAAASAAVTEAVASVAAASVAAAAMAAVPAEDKNKQRERLRPFPFTFLVPPAGDNLRPSGEGYRLRAGRRNGFCCSFLGKYATQRKFA
jgi:hypothetical protein